MSLKLRIIFVLNFLLMSSVLSQEIMGKYGSKYSTSGYVFLDVSGFDSKKYILQSKKMAHVQIHI